jgi:hypothetical protein
VFHLLFSSECTKIGFYVTISLLKAGQAEVVCCMTIEILTSYVYLLALIFLFYLVVQAVD